MNSKYKIVVVISLLLITLSISITFINYFVSLNSTERHLKTQSLPLSLDNIYTEIQKYYPFADKKITKYGISYTIKAGASVELLSDIEAHYYRKYLNIKYISCRRDLYAFISKERNFLFQNAKESRST